MTGYSDADLSEGWEFKILRSAMGRFGKPDHLRHALDEEARAGWTLVEKFDNQRLRFKRPASARAGDAALGFDPYRTTYGIGQHVLALTIMAAAFGFMGLVILIIFIATRR